MKFSAELKVSASKSATSPSCKTLAVSVKRQMINIDEHINNENWSEALALLKTGNVLNDIDFGYVFLLRVNYLQNKDVEKKSS